MPRSGKALWILIVVLVLLIAGLGAVILKDKISFMRAGESYYAAVYLESGEIYFGKLTTEPALSLTEVHFLQKDTSGNYAIAKFSEAAYQPVDEIRLNPDKVIWISRLEEASPVLSSLRAGN